VLKAPFLALGVALIAHAQGSQAAPPNKVGIIHIQNAIIGTKDGQKAATELQARFDPKRKELEKMQAEIAGLRDQVQKGSNTMSEDAKQKLAREIDQKTRAFNRETEDAQAEFDQEQNKILQGLGQKIMAVIDKYARDNAYAVILDVSSPQTPVLYAANGIDITNEVVSIYDKNAPAQTSAAPAPAAAPAAAAPASNAGKPVAPKPAAPKKP
jgi:outer membrane protein